MSKKRIFLPWGGVLDVFHCRTHTLHCPCFPLPNSIVAALLGGPVGGNHRTRVPESQPCRMLCCGEPDPLPDAQSATGSLPSSTFPLLTLPLSLSQQLLSQSGDTPNCPGLLFRSWERWKRGGARDLPNQMNWSFRCQNSVPLDGIQLFPSQVHILVFIPFALFFFHLFLLVGG